MSKEKSLREILEKLLRSEEEAKQKHIPTEEYSKYPNQMANYWKTVNLAIDQALSAIESHYKSRRLSEGEIMKAIIDRYTGENWIFNMRRLREQPKLEMPMIARAIFKAQEKLDGNYCQKEKEEKETF